ncbi:DUF4224 domain-containing protein [Salmonella enterica subsp. enterica serovar Wentworth]|nr:DUF4224 domain-containing protein [Salmonella enterica subsp. enterica serovar Wentworth]EEJ6526881.1 DUF4224 domain-containing protein [Salmonella enterica]
MLFRSTSCVVRKRRYQKPSKQREILDRGGVSYIPDREGRPMVTWTHINAVLNGQITVQTSTEEKPDFGAI